MAKVDVKVVLLGEQSVGKSCLMDRYINGTWEPSPKNTIGAAFAAKKVETALGRELTVGIWDTAGAERFESLSRLYYNGAKAAIVCFDASNRRSWQKLQRWVAELQESQPGCRIYITAMKMDLLEDSAGPPAFPNGDSDAASSPGDESDMAEELNSALRIPHSYSSGQITYRQVTEQDVTQYVKKVGAQLFHTSSKTGVGVKELFQTVAEDAVGDLACEDPVETLHPEPGSSGGIRLAAGPPPGLTPRRAPKPAPCC